MFRVPWSVVILTLGIVASVVGLSLGHAIDQATTSAILSSIISLVLGGSAGHALGQAQTEAAIEKLGNGK